MSDKLFSGEKKKIFIYMVIVFSVVSFVVFFIIMNTNVFVFEYKKEDIFFKYPSNFSIKHKKNDIMLTSNDDLANISIFTESNDSIYSNAEYINISSDIFKKYVTDEFSIIDSSCSDHMCSNLYESDKNKLSVVVEFRENFLIVYKYLINKRKFDKYSESFDLIVNSFTIEIDE